MNTVRNNRIKAVADKVLLLLAQAIELLCNTKLGHWNFAHIFL